MERINSVSDSATSAAAALQLADCTPSALPWVMCRAGSADAVTAQSSRWLYSSATHTQTDTKHPTKIAAQCSGTTFCLQGQWRCVAAGGAASPRHPFLSDTDRQYKAAVPMSKCCFISAGTLVVRVSRWCCSPAAASTRLL